VGKQNWSSMFVKWFRMCFFCSTFCVWEAGGPGGGIKKVRIKVEKQKWKKMKSDIKIVEA
jgi:hypothetical protein